MPRAISTTPSIRSSLRSNASRFVAILLVYVLGVACATVPTAQATEPESAGPYLAGSRTISVTGIAGGNANVTLRVYYPATAAGANQPLSLAGAPYPIVVFGHGFSLSVSLYATLMSHLATHGYIVAGVATEEGLFVGNLPRYIKDCEAAVIGLRAAGSNAANPLFQGIASTAKAAAIGHSFGGAAALVAASERPDLFAALVTLAATSTSPQGVNIVAAASALTVPACHFGASQDSIVPPAANLDVLYAATPSTKRLLEIAGGNHGYFHEDFGIDWLTEAPAAIPVSEQQRIVRRYQLCFLEWALRGSPLLLERFLGPTAVNDTALSRQSVNLNETLLFGNGTGALGQPYGLYPARDLGDSALILVAVALAPSPIPTAYGPFRLDPATTVALVTLPIGGNGYAPLEFTMPPVPSLSGLTFPTQAVAPLAPGNSLSNTWSITIP